LSQPAPAGAAQACKRPGCNGLIPPGTGRGRSRVFCSDDCARRYHNDARLPAPAGGGSGEADPLAALEQLLRQAGACARAAREQAAALEPAASAPTWPAPRPAAAALRPPPSPPPPARPKQKQKPGLSPKPSPPHATTRPQPRPPHATPGKPQPAWPPG